MRRKEGESGWEGKGRRIEEGGRGRGEGRREVERDGGGGGGRVHTHTHAVRSMLSIW